MQQEQQTNGTNGGYDTNYASPVFDMDIDYRYMPDGMYYGLAAAGIVSCVLSMVGATCILYFILVSSPRNGKDKQQRNRNCLAAMNLQQDQMAGTAGSDPTSSVERSSCCTKIKRFLANKRHTSNDINVSVTHEKMGLYHRLLVGLSIMDWISAATLATQPLILPSYTHYPLALGNRATCRLAGFWFYSSNGSYFYSAFLSLYFYLTVGRGKKEQEAAAILEPYAHIISVAVPFTLGVLGLSLDLFHPSVVLASCILVLNMERPECVMTNSTQQAEIGLDCSPTGAESAISWSPSLFAFASVITGAVATFLVYWKVRQQTLYGRRHAFGAEISKVQLDRTRAVGCQAIMYFLAYLNGFIITLITSLISSTSGRNVGDPTDMYGSRLLYADIFLVFILFPLQGFFNCIIFMRPRVLKWKEAEPAQSWFWCFRKVLSGYPAPTRHRQAHKQNAESSGGARGAPTGTTLPSDDHGQVSSNALCVDSTVTSEHGGRNPEPPRLNDAMPSPDIQREDNCTAPST